MRIIPGATIVFVAARLAFWVGYRIHPLYRAFGMAATGYLNIRLLGFALWNVTRIMIDPFARATDSSDANLLRTYACFTDDTSAPTLIPPPSVSAVTGQSLPKLFCRMNAHSGIRITIRNRLNAGYYLRQDRTLLLLGGRVSAKGLGRVKTCGASGGNDAVVGHPNGRLMLSERQSLAQ